VPLRQGLRSLLDWLEGRFGSPQQAARELRV
jgi:hypothetical protein